MGMVVELFHQPIDRAWHCTLRDLHYLLHWRKESEKAKQTGINDRDDYEEFKAMLRSKGFDC